MDGSTFTAGETVVLANTGEKATIMAIHDGVAWVFLGRDGFETVDFSEMTRLEPNPNLHYIEITSGVVQMAYATVEHGTQMLRHYIGQRRFFVDAIDAQGNRSNMWEGATYDEAAGLARELEADGYGVIRDLDECATLGHVAAAHGSAGKG